MAERTGIAWTEKTWNPWQGCHKVSRGCTLCYMYREKIRYGQDPRTVVRSKPATFNAPLKWKEPARVFTCSWSDWFIEEADGWRDEAWEIVRKTPHLTYQILTKRPERIAGHLPAGWPWPNVWLGVSVEDQAAADERIPHLLATPAAVRFVSCEPLLAPVDLRRWLWADTEPVTDRVRTPRLDWVIVGGESGPGARPMNVAWARSLLAQCKAANIPAFTKQLGAHVITRNDDGLSGCDDGDWQLADPDNQVEEDLDGTRDGYQGAPVRIRLVDRKGGDPSEWPSDLKVRQWPEARKEP